MHPPGGATAVTAIIGGTTIHNLGYAFVIMPIFFNLKLFPILIIKLIASKTKTNR
jgi:CBS domain-containing membrane protein